MGQDLRIMDEGPAATDLDDLEILQSNAVAAGILAAGFFRRDPKAWEKDNASPVTEADIAVDDFLHGSLLAARPSYGWLSEEQDDDGSRLTRPRVFIVDPIDGTRAFIRGEDCWTVCLSIVEAGRPVAGVVYAPARDELYAAVRSGGATLNGEVLTRRPHKQEGRVIPAPAAVKREFDAKGIEHVHGAGYSSLAYRLVQLATGRLDAVVARRGAQDWDISAADLILEEAGFALEDVCAGRPRYDRSEIRHGALAAMAEPRLKTDIHDALRHVYGCPDVPQDNHSTEPSRP